MRRSLAALILLVGITAFPLPLKAYRLVGARWAEPSTTFYVSMPGTNDLWNTAFENAMARWNRGTADFQYNIARDSYADPCSNPNSTAAKNGVKFDSTMCGQAWGASTLAVTRIWSASGSVVQAGIIFNSTKQWNVYGGPFASGSQSGIFDFGRVAVHELGHALGLDHEDNAPSIMATSVFVGSSIELPQPDDIAGVHALYGNMPDTSAPAISISLPTTNSTYNTNTSPITLSGSASDNAGVTLVTWTNDGAGTGIASGTTNWTADGISLQNGTNVITVRAYDAAGNVTNATLTVTLNPGPAVSFSFVDRGGQLLRTSGTSPAVQAGYASVQPNSGSTTPSGLAIFGYRQNNVLVSEAGVPVSALMKSGRIYAEINGPVNTGLTMANPNSQPAAVSFFFTDASGDFDNGTTTIPANGQFAAFLNERPFNGRSSLSGTFSFTSSVPISVIALRGLTNERSEFLMTTLPVIDLDAPIEAGTVILPHFANGNGWRTQIGLINPTDTTLTGTVGFLNEAGQPSLVNLMGQLNKGTFAYSIGPRSSQKVETSGETPFTIDSGSVRIIPSGNSAAPSALSIFSFWNGAATVTEAGVPVVAPATAFRLYAEVSGSWTAVGSIQTGVAVANTSSNAATVGLELTRLDGSPAGQATLSIPANGQKAIFLNEVPGLASLQTPFQGVLRVSSPVPISVIGLRGRYNERGDFLITTTPPVSEAATPSTAPLFFPHIVDGEGYTTQFVLFSGQPGQSSSGRIQLSSQTGGTLDLGLR